MSQYDNVSVVKKANVYFDGKCVSHTVLMADGSKKTVGVILPSSLEQPPWPRFRRPHIRPQLRPTLP